MKLWFVERHSGIGEYDSYWSHVIEAASPKKARQMASERSADEGSEVWFDTKKVTVTLIGQGKLGEETIWLSDFAAG